MESIDENFLGSSGGGGGASLDSPLLFIPPPGVATKGFILPFLSESGYENTRRGIE